MKSKTIVKDAIRILMLEDSSEDVLYYSMLLEKSFEEPIKIDSADTKKGAKLLIAQNEYSLVLLDLNVPDGNGVETVKEFREELGNKKPIIVLTGVSDSNSRIQALLAGADDYMVKGRDNEALCEKIIQHAVEYYSLVEQGHRDKRFV